MWYAGSPEKSNSATYQWLGKGVEGINGVGEEEVGGFCFWVVGVASVASCGTGRTLFGRCVDLVRFVVVCGELSRSANETVIFLCATARTVRGIVVRQSTSTCFIVTIINSNTVLLLLEITFFFDHKVQSVCRLARLPQHC